MEGASVSREFSTKTAAELLVFLNAHRSARLAAFRSDFPRSHYNVILLLASSICLVFLVESNQEVGSGIWEGSGRDLVWDLGRDLGGIWERWLVFLK